jgi:eukaryotic-like serine/threonine-protein kinase
MAIRPDSPATDPTLAASDLKGAPGKAAPSDGIAPAGALRPGTVVGDSYEVTRLIGQGGMGAVWEARHLRLPGKRVVVKVLLNGATDPVSLARFRREAEIGSRLGHPNIVQVLDFNTLADGTPYLVLELLQGESLAARLHREQPTSEETISIVRQIGSALAAAHRDGIVHRDLKPDNIFLVPREVGGEGRDLVKVLDFGISKIRDAKTVLTQDAALIGTPQYMAPEQATGRNDEIDPRTDIFAFGAIVFEMLAGRAAFLGDTLASVVHAVVYAPTPALGTLAPGIPSGVIAAVERALSKTREERFPDVGSFVKAVTTQSLETPAEPRRAVTVDSPGPTGVPTEKVQRGRRGWVVGVVGALVVLVAVGVWSLKRPKEATSANARTARPATAPTAASTPRPTPTPTPTPTDDRQVQSDHKAQPPVLGLVDREPAAKEIKNEPSGRAKGKEAKRVSPEAARELAEAEAALGEGRNGDAIRLAQHSLYAQKTGRAHAIIARARCAQGDLGNAKAALAQVGARERPAVIRACGKLGVELR